MKKLLLVWIAAPVWLACASTTLSREGARVRVYESVAATSAETPMPGGCRLVAQAGPRDQEESERAAADPYRKERNEAAEKGGNVLLVSTQPLLTRPNLDCSPSDKSPQCLEASQTWYRVSFGSYACAPDAIVSLDRAAESAPSSGPIFSWKLGQSKLRIAQMKSKILSMMQEGVGTDVIVAWVRGQRLKGKLTPEDIVDWKKSGIDERVIQAALATG